MPSEHRLHPATLLFDVAKHVRTFAFPAVLVWLGARSSGGPDGTFGRIPAGWEVWLLVLLVPAVAASAVRFLTFRLRYDGRELVIRSGLLFRTERHVPFAKIQNLDAIENLVHRLFGVVEIRVETGGGKGDEARLSVLPRAAFDEMRRRVFEGRSAFDLRATERPRRVVSRSPGEGGEGESETPVVAPEEETEPPPEAAAHTLLHLPPRELLLCGFLENKGMILIGAGYGIAWESGLLSGFWSRLFGAQTYGRGVFREAVTGFFQGEGLALAVVGVALGVLAIFLLVVRVISMAWAFLRLYDFRLSRSGEDLRLEYGLFTRVAATIPIRRIQTITIREGPLYRWLSRASVRVETAGGAITEADGLRDRQWLAPLIRLSALPGLLHQIVPGLDMSTMPWQPVHPRAFRRALKPGLVIAAVLSVIWAVTVGRSAIFVLMLLLAWTVIAARQYVRYLGWAEHDAVVVMRSGWIWRQETLARANKIQAVSLRQSPFDRRAGMARVRVDTAGAGPSSHRVDIPYLDRTVAMRLAGRLADQAASTEFRW